MATLARVIAAWMLCATPVPLYAHEEITTKVTWSREISRIVYKQCATCHNGGPAFSLLTYKDARPWAKAIKDEVLGRRMPPWNAVKGFGEFKDDHGLTQDDLAVISDWVEGGAPEGNPLALPPKPKQGSSEEDESPAGQKVTFTGALKLNRSTTVLGIEAAELRSGAIQIIANRPDGTIEPLIWLQNFNPSYKRPYYFRTAMKFPAGTQIQITPEEDSATLLVAPPVRSAASTATSTRKRAR